MTRRILVRPAAERDLERQADYIAANSGIDAAIKFYRATQQTFQLLASRPSIGRRTSYRHPLLAEARVFPMKGTFKHLVFYRPLPNGVEILRVVHGARDIENLFDT